MTGVSSGQGMVGCCRMGSRAGVCASPGPSDMALSAPSWAECGHCHINLETGFIEVRVKGKGREKSVKFINVKSPKLYSPISL